MKIYIVGSDDENGAKYIYGIYIDQNQARMELKSIDNSDCYIEERETDDDESKKLMYGFSFEFSPMGRLINTSRIRAFRSKNDEPDFTAGVFRRDICCVFIYSEPYDENKALEKAVALCQKKVIDNGF